MQKVILFSIVVANVAIPVWAARDRHSRRGLKNALLVLFLFDVAYLLAVRFIYPLF